MDVQSILVKRRDGQLHTEEELRFLARGAADGSIPDYQLSAWLMAAYLRPLTEQETAWFTLAIADSGTRIDLTGIPRPWVDKHSTGGVGDKTTLVLLPLLAACGLTLVKLSGRGLGITGGTVDKLESIPGFRIDLSPSEMKDQASRIGLALTGQAPDLAPADKTLYALRDVTSTVSSIPLIVSSILSKKVAGGAETIVLDVKCGRGAFMRDLSQAEDLAKALQRTAALCGLNCRLAITDMDQPLGRSAGNLLEVQEAFSILKGTNTDVSSLRFRTLCLELAALTLEASGYANSPESAFALATTALEDGSAYRKAVQWVEAQGGTILPDRIDNPAPFQLSIFADSSGWVSRIDAEAVGRAVLDLGGGRRKKGDPIDLRVGIEVHCPVGERVERGTQLFTVHAADESIGEAVAQRISSAIEFSESHVSPSPVILKVL